jgi:predicted RNA-binding protein with PIN domain
VSARGAEPIVLVDARNVVRSRWPNLREQRFLELARAWAEREGVEAHIVFDGTTPDGRIGADVVDERTAVVGTGRGSADDWIVDEVRRLAGSRQRIRVVTSDRALRSRVAPYVERVVGGGSFARVLETLERERETSG